MGIKNKQNFYQNLLNNYKNEENQSSPLFFSDNKTN